MHVSYNELILSKRQNHEKDFFKFCVLLRKFELLCTLLNTFALAQSVQESDLAPLFRDLRQSGKLSEIKPPLATSLIFTIGSKFL